MYYDENPRDVDRAFSAVLDNRAYYVAPPRNDKSFGSRAARRATYPKRKDTRVSAR